MPLTVGAETYTFAWENKNTVSVSCSQLKVELRTNGGMVLNQDSRSASLKSGAILPVPPLNTQNCNNITLRSVCSIGYDTKIFTQSGIECKSGTIRITAAGLSF